jgi:hypothetical protein
MPSFFGGRSIMRRTAGEDAGVLAGAAEVQAGDAVMAAAPAERRPLRALMDDSLLDDCWRGPGTSREGCG